MKKNSFDVLARLRGLFILSESFDRFQGTVLLHLDPSAHAHWPFMFFFCIPQNCFFFFWGGSGKQS